MPTETTGAALLALLAARGAGGAPMYLYSRQPPLIWQFSWLLFVAWVLAVFYLTGPSTTAGTAGASSFCR